MASMRGTDTWHVRLPKSSGSALARPVNQWHYGEDDPYALAAAYAFGIARNHPFVDGNKRTAWVAARDDDEAALDRWKS